MLLCLNRKNPKVSSDTDAVTTKLCTDIVRHISTINQELDFPNFYCSIVSSYCSTVCFIIKSGSKVVKILNASNGNEIALSTSISKIFLSARP